MDLEKKPKKEPGPLSTEEESSGALPELDEAAIKKEGIEENTIVAQIRKIREEAIKKEQEEYENQLGKKEIPPEKSKE